MLAGPSFSIILGCWLQCSSPSQPADKSHTNAAKQNSTRCRDDLGADGHKLLAAFIKKLKATAEAGAAVGADDTDEVVIQRHRAISREGSAVRNCCAGVQGDACEREDIAFERSVGIEDRGAADLPEHTVSFTVI